MYTKQELRANTRFALSNTYKKTRRGVIIIVLVTLCYGGFLFVSGFDWNSYFHIPRHYTKGVIND